MTDHNPVDWEIEKVKTCRFPKYDGKLWVDVIEEDREYVEWIVENIEDLDDMTYDYLMDLLEGDF